jgi:hypothetical protein
VNLTRTIFRLAVAFSFGFCLVLSSPHLRAADAGGTVPAIIESGFAAFAKGSPELAMDAWRKGGLLETDSKPGAQAETFRQMERTIGSYKSFDLIETKRLSKSSQIVYLTINFERAAVYARFLIYRADKEWVVQNMDFSLKPEALMPWLAFDAASPN